MEYLWYRENAKFERLFNFYKSPFDMQLSIHRTAERSVVSFYTVARMSKIVLPTLFLALGLLSYYFQKIAMGSSEKLVAVDFEVFGRVQGVFFRKYTEKEAKRLGLKGWCMNTTRETVVGQIEGPIAKVNEMKEWLQKTGSPQSRIERAVFTNEKNVEKCTHSSFSIKR